MDIHADKVVMKTASDLVNAKKTKVYPVEVFFLQIVGCGSYLYSQF